MSGEQLPSPEASQSPVEPRIYVASLTDYNAGILHGAWVEASLPTEDMQASVDQMLADSPTARRYGEPAEEWAIHDYEGFGPHAHIAEYESLATVGALARGIAKYDEAFVAWWSHDPPGAEGSEGDLDRRFEESYQGEYSSLEAYGEQTLDEMGLSIDDTGVHHSFIARLESGDYQTAKPAVLQRLSRVLELDERDLFALAGLDAPEGLPTFTPYLRAKYEISDEAAQALQEYFNFVSDKYDIREKRPPAA